MSITQKISAFIITKNEEKRIEKAINSIKDLVQEIIVVDSGSTDDTVKLAKKLGAKVVHNDWPGYAAQKAFAENLCTHPWVMNLDADEELSVGLRNEIAYIFASEAQDGSRRAIVLSGFIIVASLVLIMESPFLPGML